MDKNLKKDELSQLKQDMVAEIWQRVNDRVLERSNAELLEKLIIQADSDDEAIKIMSLGTTYKKSGLHYEKRLEKMDNTIRYFKKNEVLSFRTDNSKPVNKLIIGDNYEALQNLLIQYKQAIDVIYIDPPYGKDSMGEFAKTNYENGITRDNLLSMLYPRLMLAKQLLTDDGVIFCSIDDRNQAYVKCLFDEVFGESNMIATICREAIKGGTKTKNIKRVHDYVIVYAKQLHINNIEKVLLVGAEFEEENAFIYEDDTSKRLKRIMTEECYDGSKDFSWLKDNDPYGGNLDVYEIERVQNHLTADGHTPFEAIDETLYGKEKFETLKEKIDWVYRNFANSQKYVEAAEDWEERVRKG